ncbi:MAG: hypothetical protein IJ532_07450 [Alphaproteobacteria bacterium]|nr:hypothetical protein [Alphaproteobacteria bacterium]
MAKYNSFNDVASDTRFAEFIKERFGIDDVSKISPVDQNSMFNVFKSFEGDFTQDDLFGMFHEMGEALYETRQVSNDEVTRFISAKEEYIRRHPQEKEQINTDIERFLNNDLNNGRQSQTEMFGGFTYTFDEAFRNRYHNIEEEYIKTAVIQPTQEETYETVEETRRVPDLAQSVLQQGFNNGGIENNLRAEIERLPDGHEKDMFSKVLEAYTVPMTERAQKVIALNDLIVNEADIDIAEHITKTLGWDKGDYPEMDKNIEVQRVVVVPPIQEIGGNDDNGGGAGGDDNGGSDGNDEGNGGGAGGGGNGGSEDSDEGENEVILEEVRIRSHDNFDNESAMYRIELAILAERKLIPEAEAQKAIDTYTALLRERDLLSGLSDAEAQHFTSNVSAEDLAAGYELVNQGRAKIAEKDTAAYKQAIVDRVLDSALKEQDKQNGDNVWYDLLTPELTAVGIEGLQKKLNNKSLKEEEKNATAKNLNIMLNHGQGLLEDLTKKEGYYFTDITNAADEYDGYMHLADVCENAEKERNKNKQDKNEQTKVSPVYENARNLMNEYVKPYDELYHIPSGKNPKDTAIDLNDRFNKASAIIDKLEFNEDTLGKEYMEAIQNYLFVSEYDAQGNPKYEECIQLNKDGKMEVVKGSSLETALKFAANEAMMQNLGNFSQKMDKNLIMEGAKDNAFNTLFAYSNSEEVIKQGLRENPQKFTDPKYVEEFKQKLMSGEKMEISPLGAKLALDRQANHVETFSNRLTSKLGKENTEYLTAGLLGQVKKIDKTSRYQDAAKKVKNAAFKRSLIGAGLGFGIATAASYASTKLSLGAMIGTGKALPIAGGMAAELSVGGVNAAIGAVAGAAVSTLSYLAVKKVGAMIKREKYGWKDVKKDLKSPQFVSAVTAGALGGASVGFAMSGCAKCAMACGVASLAVASAGRFYAPYRDMRLHGHGKVKSAIMGVVNAAAVALGGKLGHELASTNNHVEVVANEKQAKELYKDMDAAEKEGWRGELSTEQKDGFTLVDTREGSEWVETATLKAKALDTLQHFYGHNQDALNHDLQQVSQQLHALGRDDISPEVFLRDACDAGMNTGIDTINHIDGGGIVHTHGNNLVMTDAWATQHNVDVNGVHALGGIKAPDGTITITKEALAGFDAVKTSVSMINEIGSTLNADGSRLSGHLDGVLHRNAMVDDTNTTVHAPDGKGTEFNTYANGENGYEHTTENLFAKFTKSVEAVTGFGATILSWPRKVKQFLRPGAKADRTATIEKPQDKKPEPQDKQPITVVGSNPKKKEYVKPEIIVKNIQPVTDVKDKLLNEEYQMLYGYKPDSNDKQYQAYCKRVEKELENKPEFKNMVDFLKDRKDRMNAAVIPHVTETNIAQTVEKDVVHLGGYAQAKKEKIVKDFELKRANSPLTAAIRQDFWKSNNKTADEWSFEDLITHAPHYLTQTTNEATNIDEKKAELRRDNNEAGKANRFKTKGERSN